MMYSDAEFGVTREVPRVKLGGRFASVGCDSVEVDVPIMSSVLELLVWRAIAVVEMPLPRIRGVSVRV